MKSPKVLVAVAGLNGRTLYMRKPARFTTKWSESPVSLTLDTAVKGIRIYFRELGEIDPSVYVIFKNGVKVSGALFQ